VGSAERIGHRRANQDKNLRDQSNEDIDLDGSTDSLRLMPTAESSPDQGQMHFQAHHREDANSQFVRGSEQTHHQFAAKENKKEQGGKRSESNFRAWQSADPPEADSTSLDCEEKASVFGKRSCPPTKWTDQEDRAAPLVDCQL